MFGSLLAARIVISNSQLSEGSRSHLHRFRTARRTSIRKSATLGETGDDWKLAKFHVQSEGLYQSVHLQLQPGCHYHVCISSNNKGAADVVAEVQQFLTEPLLTTNDVSTVVERKCPCCLLYLTARTWTSGEDSILLEEEVFKMLQQSLPILLVHERPSVELNAEVSTRYECEFDQFFVTTPRRLLQAKLYGPIAKPLAGGAARIASLWAVAHDLAHVKVKAAARWLTKEHTKYIVEANKQRILNRSSSPGLTSRINCSRRVSEQSAASTNGMELPQSSPANMTGQGAGDNTIENDGHCTI